MLVGAGIGCYQRQTTWEPKAMIANLNASEIKRLSLIASIVCVGILTISYVTNAMDRIIFPMLLKWISADYGFDLKSGGFLATVFTLGAGLAAWPTGWLLDRWSRKAILILGIVIYSGFTYLTTIGFGFTGIGVYRFITGVGEGMQVSALFAIVCSYFYMHKALMVGTINLGFGVGNFLGPYLSIRLMMYNNNWHTPFIIFALLGLCLAAIIWGTVPKTFPESKGPSNEDAAVKVDLSNVPQNFFNRNVLVCGLTAAVWGFCVFSHVGLYATFLLTKLNMPPVVASVAVSMMGIGGLFGMVGGWIGDRYSNRWFAIAGWACLALVWYLQYNIVLDPNVHNVLNFVVGFAVTSVVHPNSVSLLQRSARPEFIGRTTGFFHTCAYLAAGLSGFVFGWSAQRFGWNIAAFALLTILPIIAGATLLFVNQAQLLRTTSRSSA